MGINSSRTKTKEPGYKLIAACLSGNPIDYTINCLQQYSISKQQLDSLEVVRILKSRFDQCDESFHMEKKILKKNKNVPIGRCSTPTRESFFPCDDQHKEQCCLLAEESEEDMIMYSKWKEILEGSTILPVDHPLIPEAISSGSTPNWFPSSTTTEPPTLPSTPSVSTTQRTTESERSSGSRERKHTQVFYYLTVLNELDNDLEVHPSQRPTPYQLYMQQQTEDGLPRVIVWMPPQTQDKD